jgi:hypothetical protein
MFMVLSQPFLRQRHAVIADIPASVLHLLSATIGGG